MSTDVQLKDAALTHLRRMTVTWKTWEAGFKAGRYGPNSEGAKAKALLDRIGAGSSSSGSAPGAGGVKGPPPAPSTLGQRCVYFSQVTDHACQRFAQLGPGYTALFSADCNQAWTPGGAYYVSGRQLEMVRKGGGKVASWCDGDQTPVEYAIRLRDQRHLDFASGQFENGGQYDALIASGVPLGIGNPNALGPIRRVDAIQRVRNIGLALLGEVLHPDPSYSAQGIPISSACYYVDMDEAQGGYQPLASFGVMPEEQRRVCSVYTGRRMSDADWDLYAAWTRP